MVICLVVSSLQGNLVLRRLTMMKTMTKMCLRTRQPCSGRLIRGPLSPPWLDSAAGPLSSWSSLWLPWLCAGRALTTTPRRCSSTRTPRAHQKRATSSICKRMATRIPRTSFTIIEHAGYQLRLLVGIYAILVAGIRLVPITSLISDDRF